jgi:futalosine hydrolase
MKILICAATPFEIAPTLQWLENNLEQQTEGVFRQGDMQIHPLVTGAGLVATAFHCGVFLASERPDLALNAGIAGAFDPGCPLGTVFNVVTERFGDLGVEEADGRFVDLFELGLQGPDNPPFLNGLLRNPAAEQAAFLPAARGISVNKVSGAAPSIEALRKHYPDVEVESMEGAAFFYACLLAQVPFLQIRSISNHVKPRNRAAWDLPLAIGNLNEVLIGMLQSLRAG